MKVSVTLLFKKLKTSHLTAALMRSHSLKALSAIAAAVFAWQGS